MAADELHIIPVNDLIDHPSADDCVCGPENRPVEMDDGSYGWLHVHHALNGREQQESA